MRQRILSAVLLGVPVVAAVIAGGLWVVLAAWLILSIALIEFVHLVARQGHRASGGLMLLWCTLFVLDRAAPQLGLLEPGMALLLILSLGWSLIRYRQGTANAITGFAMTLAGSLYIGWSGAHLVGLRLLPDGLFWLLIVLPAVWITDTAAYFVGRAFGRNRLAPDISPGKTWEGYLGGLLVTPGAIAGLAALWHLLGAGPAMQPQHGLLIGLLVAAISPLGDLGISMLKRYAGAKDSSQLIPGHGGFLDRIDAALIGALLGYYYITLVVL